MVQTLQLEEYLLWPDVLKREKWLQKVLRKGKSLHQKRVVMKRMRALCILLDFTYKKKHTRRLIFDSYKNFYQASSNLRDIVVQKRLADSLNSLYGISVNVYVDFLNAKNESVRKSLPMAAKLIKPKSWKVFVKDVNKFLNRKSFRRHKKNYLVSHISRINRALSTGEKSRDLHWMRKQMKKTIYINALGRKEDLLIKGKLQEQMNTIEVGLGRWHDWQVFSDNLDVMRNQNDDPAYIKSVEEIKRFVKLEQYKTLHSIAG